MTAKTGNDKDKGKGKGKGKGDCKGDCNGGATARATAKRWWDLISDAGGGVGAGGRIAGHNSPRAWQRAAKLGGTGFLERV